MLYEFLHSQTFQPNYNSRVECKDSKSIRRNKTVLAEINKQLKFKKWKDLIERSLDARYWLARVAYTATLDAALIFYVLGGKGEVPFRLNSYPIVKECRSHTLLASYLTES